MAQQKGMKRAVKVAARKSRKLEQERAANFRRMERAEEVAQKEELAAAAQASK